MSDRRESCSVGADIHALDLAVPFPEVLEQLDALADSVASSVFHPVRATPSGAGTVDLERDESRMIATHTTTGR
jgi:hypothetical protein